MTLTTNDVVVLRVLRDRGAHTQNGLICSPHISDATAERVPGRLTSLLQRGLVTERPGTPHPTFAITATGKAQLRRADHS